MTLFRWSRTAANNATIDVTAPFPEGMSASALNDSSRGQMAAIAKYRDDVAGAITTSGTATAYTVTSFQGFDTLANLSGQNIAFVPHATNTNAVGVDCNLSVDSLGNKPIRMAPGVAIPGGTLILGTPYIVTYNNSDGVFYLQNMTNPYVIPVGSGMDFWGSTTPNSSFAFPAGQAISRTVYSNLFNNILGTGYGAGDGSTTFNLPDKRGRVSAGVDNMGGSAALRLTSASGMGTGTGGAETHTLTAAELPAHTHSGTTGTESANHTHGGVPTLTNVTTGSFTGTVNNSYVNSGGSSTGTQSATHTHSFTTDAGTGGAGAHAIVQPTICCNYIIRII